MTKPVYIFIQSIFYNKFLVNENTLLIEQVKKLKYRQHIKQLDFNTKNDYTNLDVVISNMFIDDD